MTNSKSPAPIKLRETVPNPEGGEWPHISEAQSDKHVEEGEKKTYSRVADATEACLMFASKQMQVVHTAQAMGLPQPIISALLHSLESDGEAPQFKVFTIKPGQELPQELTDLLRGRGTRD